MDTGTADQDSDFETVSPSDVAGMLSSLNDFLAPYRPLMARAEQRKHLGVFVEGLLSDLERKSIEPIASRHGLARRPLQTFVGSGRWDDFDVRERMQHEIAQELGQPDAALVLDSSAFPKYGPESVGVARQWCGRLGKVDNCQLGYFLVYSSQKGDALVDAELYLPKSWADDAERRAQTHVPEDRVFLKGWEIADELLVNAGPRLPHGWVLGDDEFGRPSEFRDRLADRGERYLLEVPSTTRVRRPANWPGSMVKWRTVAQRRKKQTRGKWQRVVMRDGQKGPIEVKAFATRVETSRKVGTRLETLLVVQSLNHTRTWYFLGSADAPLNVAELVRAASHRHHIEQVFQAAKGEVGLDHFEVRSWVGWHHHMTLSMLAHWFLVRERRRLAKKNLH